MGDSTKLGEYPVDKQYVEEKYAQELEYRRAFNGKLKQMGQQGCDVIAKSPRPSIENADICANHAPSQVGLLHIAAIRTAARIFLDAISEHCPPCADKAEACRKVREAMMTANASIALNGAI